MSDPIRYASGAISEAIGAVLVMRTEHNGADQIIERLRTSLGKLAEFEGCDHDWAAGLDPRGGASGMCRKCGLRRHVDERGNIIR